MKHKRLPNNLTYEQFKALAEQEPDMSADCVYELTCYKIDDPEKPLYPKFSIYRVPSMFMFRTKEEAEAYMHGIVSGDKKEQINISKEIIGTNGTLTNCRSTCRCLPTLNCLRRTGRKT